MSDEHQVERRVEELADRIRRIERRLGLPRDLGGAAGGGRAAESGTHPDSGPVPVLPRAARSSLAADTAQEVAPVDPASAPSERADPRRRADLERLIGGRWFGVAGAAIILVGVGLFIKWAYDQGWIGEAMQCVIVAGFGALLLGSGEFVRRRVGRAASIGPSAAGLGALYLATFAAREVYGLVSVESAMGLMIATTLFGLVLAATVRLASLAGASMFGGFLAPVILSTGEPSAVFMPSYLVVLQAVGSGLAAWFSARPEAVRFRALRTLGWGGTVVLGSLWVFDTGLDVEANALLFLAGVWLVSHADLVLTSFASMRVRPGMQVSEQEASDATLWRAGWVAGSLATTAWCAVLGVLLMRSLNATLDWSVTAALGAMCGAVAGLTLTLDPLPEVLRRGARNPREQLGAGLLVETGALVIASVALGLGGWAQVGAWLALGAGAAASGRWVRSSALYAYGLVVLAIAAGRLLLLDFPGAFDGPVATEIAGLAFGVWSAQMGIAGVAWIVSGWLMATGEQRAWQGMGAAGVFIGGGLLALAPLHAATEFGPLTLWFAGLGVLGMLAHGLERRVGGEVLSVCVVVAGIVPWTIAFLRDGWIATDSTPGLHPGLGVAIVLAGVSLGAGILAMRGAPRETVRWLVGNAGLGFAGGILFGATSLEIGRVAQAVFANDPTSRAAVLSIWWGLYGLALLVLGFVFRSPVVRYGGLGLIVIAAAKAVLFDLAQVSMGWRVGSFIGLGLLMVGVAVAYQRVAVLVKRGERARVPDDSPAGPGEVG